MICGSNEHKARDCSRAHSFTTPQTGGNVSSVQKGNKSVASQSVPKQGTQTLGIQDARAPARAYAMKAMEDTDAPDVIVGNFQIFDTTINALIDPGSTHSYIRINIPSLGKLPRSETEYDILVTNPLGHSVIVNKVYRDCPIRIREYEFSGNLIELSFKEFDVILGIDWLSFKEFLKVTIFILQSKKGLFNQVYHHGELQCFLLRRKMVHFDYVLIINN